MSTRPRLSDRRSSNSSLDNDDLSLGSTHSVNRDSLSSTAKPRKSSGGKSPKQIRRRQSRVPRSLSEHGSLLMTTLEGDLNPSLHNSLRSLKSSSQRSLLEERSSGKRRTLADQRSRSCHSMRSARTTGGVSSRGGEKDRSVASEDDSWQMFKEALQNMA